MILSTDELFVKISATINRGIAQAIISEDGHLIFIMSDGEQIDLGDIQGPVLEALKAYVDQNQVLVDETLTEKGQAADAFVVGDAFRETKQDISDRLPKSGGTMTGPLDMGGNSITGADSVQAAALAVTPVGSDPDAGGYLAAGNSELGDGGIPVRIMELYGNAGDEPVVLRHLGTPRQDSDAANKAYVDAVAGSAGADGGYYTPAVDDSGNLTWTASKSDMPAVDGANIKGPKGDTGPQGPQGEKGDTGATGSAGVDGKSAYQYAQDGGYTGTEEEFAKKLAGSNIETNLYDPTHNIERSKYDNSGTVVSEYGWYRTSDMDLNGKKSIIYGGLDKTAVAETVRSVFKDSDGNVVSVFLPVTGENELKVPDGATYVSFTLHMDDVDTFYAKIVTRSDIADVAMEDWHAKIGDRLYNLLQKATQKKICCIVDDDTADTDSVNLFKNACDASGIKGTLATLTYNWTKDSNLKDTLLSMERDGFQVVIHAFAQVDAWSDPDANSAVCESNLVHGMQDMQSAGFMDYKYWVTPYCKDTDGIQSMARKLGMKCALAGGNTYEPADDTYGRYALRRAAFGVDDNSSSITLEQLHSIAQDAAGNNGWLIVMTHFETWKNANENSGTETVTPTWTKGQYILYTSGTVMESSAYALTDYIDVSGYDTVNVLTKIAGQAGVCLYDAEQKYIAGYQPDGLTEIDVSDASYIRVSCWYTSGSFTLDDVVIECVTGTVSEGGYTRFTELIDYLKGLGYEFMTIAEAWSYRKAVYDLYDMF